jgi:hypothetical protein
MTTLLNEYETSQATCTRKCVSFNAHKGQDITRDIKQMTSGPNYGLAANFCVGTPVDDIGKKKINMTVVDELIDSCAKINTQKDEIQQLIYMWFVGIEEGNQWSEQFDQVLSVIERAQSLFRETTSSGKPNYIYTVRLNKMLKLKNPTPKQNPPPKPPKPTRKMSSPIKLSSMKTRKLTHPTKPPKPMKKMVSPSSITLKMISPKMTSLNQTQKCGNGLPRCKKGFHCNKKTSTCDEVRGK